MNNIPSLFGDKVFNDTVMRERLPSKVYEALQKIFHDGNDLPQDTADVIAHAMKNWALENEATHFTHWFQPMNNSTAGKHDSFIFPDSYGKVIMEFSGKDLISGESDASSFPSGGLRSVYAARGYTAWDPTSYAFIKNNVLYIPTVFLSYSGEALDKKTPLLRSEQALNRQALRVLRILGYDDTKRVFSTAGVEQEYFLIDEDVFLKRPDLHFCGRTLFGAPPVRSQRSSGHYMGSIHPKIISFMDDVEKNLWELGVYAKTVHNEVAPSQYEIVPIFTTSNLALDHNQITMDILKTTASRHGLACILNEKPFDKINGSGKHVNWSIATDDGLNLLSPGDQPQNNLLFLLFLVAILRGVDKYADILRLSTASVANDIRLGAHEAPPAIISVFLGEELTQILLSIANGEDCLDYPCTELKGGAKVLPIISKDISDRNRSSTLAFTGAKFEFRMPGASSSVGDPLVIMNTMLADSLKKYADILEEAETPHAAIVDLLREQIQKHNRIIFNGNNYSKEWAVEAERRGLSNYPTLIDVLPRLLAEKNVSLFNTHKVYSTSEIHSRFNIFLDNYCETLKTESRTCIDMVNKWIIPSIFEYQNMVADLLDKKKRISKTISSELEKNVLTELSNLSTELYSVLGELTQRISSYESEEYSLEQARFYLDYIYPEMQKIRTIVDKMEIIVGEEYWSLPSYDTLLHSIY